MALETLRARLRQGAYVLGEPLTIVDLAHDMSLSPTPVREALSRLAGEGLVEDRRGRGYFAPRVDVADLTELYALNLLHLTGALEFAQARKAVGAASPETARDMLDTLLAGLGPLLGLAAFSEHLFDRVIAVGGNRALAGSYRVIADRLGPARRVEPEVLEGMAEEVAQLAALFDAGNLSDFRECMGLFHDRRREQARHIVEALRARRMFQ
ncbi:GntR family transcriptional regulator [Phenylobacterium sp. 58.2.17]|uniref:GntR family transcriptional regulator n=1 Tax=Phenylobacterium sp. 58.2.17 TaxID=2969306 RepID=UPI002264309A|nr:GntR family transcriptional regulator [Phenylobacterium sp. 58.2.17]MCX7587288.1 GntR family transcriptional regulator [Phenylobacterium sp. 58.2.17]